MKLNFDATSKGNLSLIKYVGSFQDNGGQALYFYVSSFGINITNLVELFSLETRILHVVANDFTKLQVDRDS